MKTFLLLPAICFCVLAEAQNKIIIELHASPEFYKNKHLSYSSITDSIALRLIPYDHISIYPESEESDRNVSKISNGKVKWTIYTNKPLIISSPVLGTVFIFNPGDSLRITYNGNIASFSGNSADAFKLQSELLKAWELKGPTKNAFVIRTLEDYFTWMRHLNKKSDLMLSVLDSYKNKVSPFTFEFVKQTNVEYIERDRTSAFNGLYDLLKDSAAHLTFSDLSNIWDSTQSNTILGQWLRSQPRFYPMGYYLYDYNRAEVRRKYNFDYTKDPLLEKKTRVELYYNHAKAKYTGHVLEKLLQYMIANAIIDEMGPTDSFTQRILKDFYSVSKESGYKEWMGEYLEKKMELRVGKSAPYFKLTDRSANEFNKNDLKGKIALLDFWFSGCTGCVQMTPALKKIEEKFKNDSNIVFVSVSIDKDKERWEKSIKQGKYTTGTALNLYTGGVGDNHDMIKRYDIKGYPELILLNAEGRIIANPVPDPRSEEGMKQLIDLLKDGSSEISAKKHALANDGPYVLYKGKIQNTFTVLNNVLENKTGGFVKVQTDVPGKSFTVKLKTGLKPEAVSYMKPSKLIALSDIEGNFDAFRLLLQKNKVIDNNFNWTFGKGHLVFAGDMFDRGLQVTECLWLVYSLEEKAKKAGGYVHFILGNHEIMNMKGDHHYAQQKYHDNAKLIGKTIKELYNEDSELGRWLRTKNIIEKIGNLLFAHGGIAPEVNRLPLSIEQINNLVRPYYGGAKLDSSNKHLLTLFNDKAIGGRDKTAPFWFRGYYGDGDNPSHIPTIQQLDSTLQKFNVNRVVTGHTIVADTISVHYGGKVINTDTKHAEGKSEALLIEGDKYYRVNAEGKKVLLFIDNNKRKLMPNTPKTSEK